MDHDSRVLRIARLLRSLDFETSVLGVVSWTEKRQLTEYDGIPIRRISPTSRLAWLVYRQASVLRPKAPSTPGEPRPGRSSGGPAASPIRGPLRRLARFGATLAYYRRAIAFVRAIRPDLVHCNDYNTMWIGLAARYLAGSVVVYDSHELWPDRNLRPEPRWWLMLCEALFVRVADRVVTTSPAYAELMARRYRIPAPTVVRNIPAQGRRASRDGSSSATSDGLVTYVGGLQPNRGLEPAIRAIAGLEEVRLRLLGPALPEYRARLERLVDEEGVAERVDFAAPVAPADVLEALDGAALGLALIQPACLSYRLTLPNKLFEYTLAGVPILGSNLPMITRFVHEHGVDRLADDVGAVAAAIGSMLVPGANAGYRERAAQAAERLDPEKELAILAGVYREAGRARGRLADI